MSILGRRLNSAQSNAVLDSVAIHPSLGVNDELKVVMWNSTTSRFELTTSGTPIEDFKKKVWGILVTYIAAGEGRVYTGGLVPFTGAVAGNTYFIDLTTGQLTTTSPSNSVFVKVGVVPTNDVVLLEKIVFADKELLGVYSTLALLNSSTTPANLLGFYAVVNQSNSVDAGLYRVEFNNPLYQWQKVLQSSHLSAGQIEALVGHSGTALSTSNKFVDAASSLTVPSTGTTGHALVKTAGGREFNLLSALYVQVDDSVMDLVGDGATTTTTTLQNALSILNTRSLALPTPTAANRVLTSTGTGPYSWSETTAANTKILLSLNNVENTALSTWTGSTNITTLGTITTGTWTGSSIAGTYLTAMTGANGTVAGTKGAVPAPTATDNNKFLKGDATWATVTQDPSITQVAVTTSTYSFTNADNGKMFLFNYTGGNCTVTVPDTLTAGFNVTLLNEHATNLVVFSGSGTMTLSSKVGLTLQAGFASASLFVKSSTKAYLVGALQA